MRLSIGLLTGIEHQALGAFLLHSDCEVKTYSKLMDFLSDGIAEQFDIVFLGENFLATEDDYQRIRTFLDQKNEDDRPRLIFLSDKLKIFRIPHSGVVFSEDYTAIKNIIKDTVDVKSQVSGGYADSLLSEEEVVEVIEEEILDGESKRLVEGIIKLKGAQSLDELGVLLVHSLANIVQGDRRGVYFKYLPTYCSLVVLDGFNFRDKKVNGIGLNFSNSKEFKAKQHLSKLKFVPAFTKVVERIFGHQNIEVQALESDGEVKGVLVYENIAKDFNLKVLCDFAEAKMTSLVYKHKYVQNKINDELTGCILRAGFFNQLQNEIIRSKRVLLPVSVMLFEVDGYYGLKTRYNEERVKTLVKSFAQLLKENVRHNDLVGKLGECKFAIVFPHMSTNDALIKAKKMSKLIAQTQFFSDMKNRLICSASIAMGTYPTQISSADELVVSLETTLANKESAGSTTVLIPKPGFVKDFEEMSLPDSFMNRRKGT